jgi:hypothetical protein
MFYHGNESDPANRSMDAVMSFKPFRDFFAQALPPGISDKDYVIAQYDGAVAYMDACIQSIFTALDTLDVLENTIVVVNGDHGETLYEHDCYFDHHGMYDNVLHVPLMIRYPAKLPRGTRIKGYNQHKDLLPTLLDLANLPQEEIRSVSDLRFDGRSLLPMIRGEVASHDSSFYITECTWMRKHGWRTPEWVIIALDRISTGSQKSNSTIWYKTRWKITTLPKSDRMWAHLRGSWKPGSPGGRQKPGWKTDADAGDWHGMKGIGPSNRHSRLMIHFT